MRNFALGLQNNNVIQLVKIDIVEKPIQKNLE